MLHNDNPSVEYVITVNHKKQSAIHIQHEPRSKTETERNHPARKSQTNGVKK